MTVHKVTGLETEFGVLEPSNPHANPIELSSILVDAYAEEGTASGGHGAVRWDFDGEDPLNDARGFRIQRAAAHPSQLTDDPRFLAPSAEDISVQTIKRPDDAILLRARASNTVLPNGARLYVDHAHPEYASPETINPREAVLWDRAGEKVMVEAMNILNSRGRNLAVYKNNVDGKGAAYGSHENYLVDRNLPFSEIIRYITPFFVTRPILCGSGRLGLGPASQEPGFQISQRADYVENDVGLETTFNRPIINTRDEPHALESKYRRFHVIGGDANQFDASILLKVGTTSLVLWMLEQDAVPLGLESIIMDNPVQNTWLMSQDPSLQRKLELHEGPDMTALEIQQLYLDAVREVVEERGGPDWDTAEVLELWQRVLDLLKNDFWGAAPYVEWVAKYQLLDQMRMRGGGSWDSDKLRALDLQWHDLRPDKSIVAKLRNAGRIHTLFTDEEIAYAVSNPPESTRAYLRGRLVGKFADKVAAAGWSSILLDPHGGELVRIALPYPEGATKKIVGTAVDQATTLDDFLHILQTKERNE